MVRGQIFVILFLSFFCSTLFAQEKIEVIKPCVDSIVNIPTSKHTVYEKLKISVCKKSIALRGANFKRKYNNTELNSWINKMNIDSLEVFKLNESLKAEAYLFKSFNSQSAGLAVNFTSFLIFIPNKNVFIEFESLAVNEKLIYFDDVTNSLKYIRFSYGENFFWKRDWNDIDFKIETYEIKNSKTNLIKSSNLRCE